MPPFKATLMKVPGKGGWTFAPVPEEEAPQVSGAWGMTPVQATVNGHRWSTSVWRDRVEGVLLPIPARVRGALGDGDEVLVEVVVDDTRAKPAVATRKL